MMVRPWTLKSASKPKLDCGGAENAIVFLFVLSIHWHKNGSVMDSNLIHLHSLEVYNLEVLH